MYDKGLRSLWLGMKQASNKNELQHPETITDQPYIISLLWYIPIISTRTVCYGILMHKVIPSF